MLEIFTKTFTSFVDKNLSALLLGAAGMLVLLFQYWKIPDKWDKLNDRLEKIEERQRKIFDYFKYSDNRPGKRNVNIDEDT